MNQLRSCEDKIPVRSPMVCVILLRPGQAPVFGCSLTEKRSLLKAYTESERSCRKKKDKPCLICVWPGSYHSDAFEITREKLSEVVFTAEEFFQISLSKSER